MGEAAKLFTKSILLGIDHSVEHSGFAAPPAEDIETLPFEEAVNYLKKRDVLNRIDYYKLSDRLRYRAFTAGRIADGDLLAKINTELTRAVEDGTGLSSFLSMTKDDLLDKVGMGGGSGWYWENVYRTNVQTAYNAGRAIGFAQSEPLALELIVIDDTRTSDYCRPYISPRVILPFDDPFWQSHWPPLHFSCRSTVRGIYDRSELPDSWPDIDSRPAGKGFGTYPLQNDSWWKELAGMKTRAESYGVQGEIEAAKKILIDRTADFKEAGTIKEANGYAVSMGCSDADYTGADIRVANAWNKSIHDTLRQFPELKENMSFTGTVQNRNRALKETFINRQVEQYYSLLKKANPDIKDEILKNHARKLAEKDFLKAFKASADTYAVSSIAETFETNGIGRWKGVTVNKKFAADFDLFERYLKMDVQIKWHPAGCDTVKSVIDHELGHQIDELLDLSNNQDIIKLYRSLTHEEITDGLSEYSWHNSSRIPVKEFIAEAWSEYVNSPAPRDIARKVGAIIKGRYAEWKK